MKANAKEISIGIVGAGARLRHVIRQVIEADSPIKIVAAYDPHAESIEVLKKEFGTHIETAPSEEALIDRPDIDWVFIGSFNHAHGRQAVRALRAGKHVFCEKPLATSLADCLAVRAAAEESGRIFSFGLVLRYAPHYQRLRELVAGGRIGQLISFEFNETLHFNHGGYIFGNWRRDRTLAGTHLLEKCCHDIDLANWIVGSLPVSVASFGGRNFFVPENEHHIERIGPDPVNGRPAFSTWVDPHRVNPFSAGANIVDNQVAILQYANQVRASFHTNCQTAIQERRFYLCGTEGNIRADAITGRIEVRRTGYDTVTEIYENERGSHAGGDQVMGRALRDTLLHGVPPQAGVEDGIRACVVAFGIDQAMEENQVIDLRGAWARAGIDPAGA